jgi:dephospho-CoA kinase
LTYCVGLTGGIGSGKSLASALFAELGAGVVDTDEISRALTAPGGAAMSALRDAFGPGYVAADGGLDRARMRDLVFGDPDAKRKLEGILHPLIRSRTRAAVGAAREPYVIAVIPLLFETGAYSDLVQRVVVVDCDEGRQVERAAARGAMAEADVRRIVAAQLPRAERLKRADDVLDNDGGVAALRSQVARLHARYLDLARKEPAQ